MSQPNPNSLSVPLDLLQVFEPVTNHDLQHGSCDRCCENCKRSNDVNDETPSAGEQEGMTDAA